MSKNGNRNGLADPSRLRPVDKDDNEVVRVIIETPKGSRNKYAFDQDERAFTLKRVLPAGMAFPHDFGFVPSTLAEDGDPMDVLVLDGRASLSWLRGEMPPGWSDRRRAGRQEENGAQ
ncbi:MAG TPA: inorganic diphosphatase [Candidatus Acidoferrum sp.]|nr:inorganic diphosphatase [Candidatus Acidoferrum sp.]